MKLPVYLYIKARKLQCYMVDTNPRPPLPSLSFLLNSTHILAQSLLSLAKQHKNHCLETT